MKPVKDVEKNSSQIVCVRVFWSFYRTQPSDLAVSGNNPFAFSKILTVRASIFHGPCLLIHAILAACRNKTAAIPSHMI